MTFCRITKILHLARTSYNIISLLIGSEGAVKKINQNGKKNTNNITYSTSSLESGIFVTKGKHKPDLEKAES